MVWLLGGAALARIRCIVKLCRDHATGIAPTRRQPRPPKPTEAVEFDNRSTCWVGGLRLIPRYCSKYASHSTGRLVTEMNNPTAVTRNEDATDVAKRTTVQDLCSSAPHEANTACFKRHNA